MSLDTARLALLIGQTKEVCEREISALGSIPLDHSNDIDIAWHLSAIEMALFASIEQIVDISGDFFPVSEEVHLWSPGEGIKTRYDLVESWLEDMHERVAILGRLYEEARERALDEDIGEEDISIDDLFRD